MFLFELYRKKENPFINIAYTVLGMIYIVITFAMLFHLGYYENNKFTDTYSFQIILGFFIMLWTNDTGAYLAGRFFGKHKLFERISPKKTWEGSVGGGLVTIGCAYILSIFFTNLGLTNWIIDPIGPYGFWIGFIFGLTAAAILLAWRLQIIQKRIELVH